EVVRSQESVRASFAPTNNLVAVGKIPRHLPKTLAVFRSKCRPVWILDYLDNFFVNDLKSVTDQWGIEITRIESYFARRKFCQLRLRCKRLVAINRHRGQRIGRALRVRTRKCCSGYQEPKTECLHHRTSFG